MKNKGFKTCHHCKGDGINRDYKDLYIYRRIKSISGFVTCRYCQGVGKIDWVENIIHREYPISGVILREAIYHLCYIFNLTNWNHEEFRLDFDDMTKLYFKMYNLYIKDKVFGVPNDGSCRADLMDHFMRFDDHWSEREQQIIEEVENERKWNLIDRFQFQQETGMCL